MTSKSLKENNSFYSIKKHGNYYLAFSETDRLKGVSVYKDVFGDGSYLAYQSGCLDYTLADINFWLHGHGYI